MRVKNVISWFATTQGRQFVFTGVCCTGIGISLSNFLSHTFLLHKYREIVQMYGLGIEVPVATKVKRRFEEVMDDMKLSNLEHKMIKPFTVFGFDIFHAGYTQTRCGAVVGIPSNFNYDETSDIDRRYVLVNMDQVSWGTEAGKKLLDAMILSEEAQKFAMGREIAHVRTPYVYLNTTFPTVVIAIQYAITTNCNKKLDLLSRPLTLRLILYTIVGLFGFGLWAFMKDFTTVHFEAHVDKVMCSMGESYIKGGIEFYSKLLNRNIALRKLMGTKGEKLYTTTGNENYMIRQLHMPLTYRKEYVQLQHEDLKKKHEESSVKILNEQNSLKVSVSTDTSIPA